MGPASTPNISQWILHIVIQTLYLKRGGGFNYSFQALELLFYTALRRWHRSELLPAHEHVPRNNNQNCSL